MADQITYPNKTDSVILANPDNEKVRSGDMNEIKSVVNQNATELDGIAIITNTVAPIGNIVANPGTIYKRVDVAGFIINMFIHSGVVPNDTDWSLFNKTSLSVEAGSNLNTTITIPAINTLTPIDVNLTLQNAFRISQSAPGILLYSGPKIVDEGKKIDVSIAAIKTSGGVTVNCFFIIRKNPIATGVWENAGFGVFQAIDATDVDSLFTTTLINGFEDGDRYQVWMENQENADDIDIQSIEIIIF